MAQSPDEMAKSMIANMKEKTGKTLPQWVGLAKKCGEAKHGGIVRFLKTEHGMTHGFANLVAHATFKGDPTKAGDADESSSLPGSCVWRTVPSDLNHNSPEAN